MPCFLIGASAVLQIAAALLALSLIRVTRRRWAWLLISGALGLMAARRVFVFVHLFSFGAHPESSLASDIITLATSALMLAGVAAISPIFRELMSATQRLKAGEARYRDLSERLRTVFEGAPVGIYQSTPEGRLLSANPTLARIYGYGSPEELMGSVRDVADLYDDPEDRRALLRLLEAEGRVEGFECRMRRRDGQVIWTSRSVVSVRGAQGNTIHFDAFLTDITDRKEAEEQREHVERVVRHDLKSPLQGIVSLPEAMSRDANLTERQREFLGMIKDTGFRMLAMINNSLNIHKMEAGTYKPERESVDLVHLVGRALADGEALVRAKRLVPVLLVDGVPAEAGDKVEAWGEESLLLAMFGNLVNNALEASPEGVEVRAALFHEGGRVRAVVENSGVIPKEIRKKFFGKYVTWGKAKGTGLGAYSARLIAVAHGGDLSFSTSDEENRTIVEAVLPARPGGLGEQ